MQDLPMTITEIVAAARKLPMEEREQICAQIAESLDVPLTAEEQAWADVADRRAAELRSGAVPGVPADEVFAKARQRLGM
jgi:putative addiction module component (TIGR02574 family)